MARFVVAGRGSKMPSLYLDLAAGKGRTEVPYLNGAVAQAAEQAGRAAPVNRRLWQVLDAICEGRDAWDDWRDQPDRLLSSIPGVSAGRRTG
jgi:2-dehydropantoate 2-reductase